MLSQAVTMMWYCIILWGAFMMKPMPSMFFLSSAVSSLHSYTAFPAISALLSVSMSSTRAKEDEKNINYMNIHTMTPPLDGLGIGGGIRTDTFDEVQI